MVKPIPERIRTRKKEIKINRKIEKYLFTRTSADVFRTSNRVRVHRINNSYKTFIKTVEYKTIVYDEAKDEKKHKFSL